LNEDGTWTVYLAKEDLGIPNWIGTGGHSEGLIFCRWLLAEHFPEIPNAEVLARSALVERLSE